ncbi:hypothetical protein NC653_030379 [Populus alba x Populus x berolinensis]|uniref:Uncharacterized protein n=1 Tax=Populus alba x Populus x berolinensis TaxID=444605 RepID=A0AAD6LW72_9ROSI|nr:hypothetical protein NC653_030379 [Populus alba x Populus x berolinensis]
MTSTKRVPLLPPVLPVGPLLASHQQLPLYLFHFHIQPRVVFNPNNPCLVAEKMGEGKIESCGFEDTPEIDYSIQNHPLSTSNGNRDREREAARLGTARLGTARESRQETV